MLALMWRSTRFLFFVLFCGCALGCWTFFSAPKSVFPAISLARVEVFVDAGTLTPERVRERIAGPLESAFAGIPSVRATRAYADQGKLEIELDFDPGSDVREDLRNVQAVIAEVRERLPIGGVTSLIEGPNMEPVVTYALTTSLAGQSELRERVERALLPVFTGTPGLGRITVFGGPRRGIRVTLETANLRAIG
jgi:multidrug efflux pump subunit AcrB